MQSIFNQSFMIGGVLTPNFVTAFIIRDPKDVGTHEHELSPWMWLVPISSLTMIIGLIYEEVVLGKNELGMLTGAEITEEEEAMTETTKLVKGKSVSNRRRSSTVEIKQRLSRQVSTIWHISITEYYTSHF